MIRCELLATHHDRQAFDCDQEDLNRFLKQYAKQQGKRQLSKTYVLIDTDKPNNIMGYYTLSATSIQSVDIENGLKGYPKHIEIPAILIGRLAVDKREAGQGYARYLIAHALKIIKDISQSIGVTVIVIDAKNQELVKFYQQFGFVQTKKDSLKLIMLVKTLFP